MLTNNSSPITFNACKTLHCLENHVTYHSLFNILCFQFFIIVSVNAVNILVHLVFLFQLPLKIHSSTEFLSQSEEGILQ